MARFRQVPDLVAYLSALVLCFLSTSCSTTTYTYNEVQKHVVMVQREGFLIHPKSDPAGKFAVIKDDQAAQAYFKGIVENLTADCPTNQAGKKQILIFVHGGLNSVSQSLRRADELLSESGTNGITRDYYPIFINWNSGFLPTYWEHLWNVRQGEIKPGGALAWSKFLAPFYLIADAGRAVVRAPIVLVHQLDTDRKTMPAERLRSRESKDAEAIYCELYHQRMESLTNAQAHPLFTISVGNDRRSNLDKFGGFCGYLATFPTKVATGPVIDTGGTSAWENMLRRTRTMFRTAEEFDLGTNRIRSEQLRGWLDAPQSGAVARFMQHLSQNLPGMDNPFSSDYEITLIGHSMGTIVLNELIRRYDRLPYKNIVYMGAACTVNDFQDSVVPYLQRHSTNGVNFYNLCLHPLAERRETNLKDLIPRGSLLEWIDNFLSAPETVPDRTLGKFENFMRTAHMIPPEVRSQVHVKGFNVQGGKTKVKPYGVGEWRAGKDYPGCVDDFPEGNPQRHGEFGETSFWKEAFWKPKPLITGAPP